MKSDSVSWFSSTWYPTLWVRRLRSRSRSRILISCGYFHPRSTRNTSFSMLSHSFVWSLSNVGNRNSDDDTAVVVNWAVDRMNLSSQMRSSVSLCEQANQRGTEISHISASADNLKLNNAKSQEIIVGHPLKNRQLIYRNEIPGIIPLHKLNIVKGHCQWHPLHS